MKFHITIEFEPNELPAIAKAVGEAIVNYLKTKAKASWMES